MSQTMPAWTSKQTVFGIAQDKVRFLMLGFLIPQHKPVEASLFQPATAGMSSRKDVTMKTESFKLNMDASHPWYLLLPAGWDHQPASSLNGLPPNLLPNRTPPTAQSSDGFDARYLLP